MAHDTKCSRSCRYTELHQLVGIFQIAFEEKRDISAGCHKEIGLGKYETYDEAVPIQVVDVTYCQNIKV